MTLIQYNIVRPGKQTYIPNICSIFGIKVLTQEYLFDIIRIQNTSSQQMFVYGGVTDEQPDQ